MRISYILCYHSRYQPRSEDYHWITYSNHLSSELRDSLKKYIFRGTQINEQYCFFPLNIKRDLEYVGVSKRWSYGKDFFDGDIMHSALLLFRKTDWVLINPTIFIQHYLGDIFCDIQKKYWNQDNYWEEPIINSGSTIDITPDIPWGNWKEFVWDYKAAEIYTPKKFESLTDIQVLLSKNKLLPFQKAVSTFSLNFPYEVFTGMPKSSFKTKRNIQKTYKPLLAKMIIEEAERDKMNKKIQKNLNEIARYFALFKISDSEYLIKQKEKYVIFIREYRNNNSNNCEEDRKKLGEDIIRAEKRLERDISGLRSNHHEIYNYFVEIVNLCEKNELIQKPDFTYQSEDSKNNLYLIIKRILDLYGKTAKLCLNCLAIWNNDENGFLEQLVGLANVGERVYFPRVLLEMPKPIIEFVKNSREVKKVEDNRAFPEQESVELTGKDPEENPEADLLPKSMKDSK